jgi:hypothetical protein
MMTPEHVLLLNKPRPAMNGKTTMAKKAQTKTSRPKSSAPGNDTSVPVSKQTAGGVAGAVLGGAVLGPLGAIAGGVTGAMVGDASAKGKKPVKKAVEAIRTEVSDGRVKEAFKSVTARMKTGIQSLRKKKKTKKSATAKKSATKGRATKKAKAKSAKKAKTAKKKAATRKKKRAKKKS